jgi:uncharacterized protein YutE (UPF0331/DUF86 family)
MVIATISARWHVVDRDRILVKVDELDSYLKELSQIMPANFAEYMKIEKRRSCERLLQLSIECAIDICKLLVTGLRLGIPSDENDFFEKLQQQEILSEEMAATLKTMKGFRNILVHEYAAVDDQLVYELLTTRLDDFWKFKREILRTTG